MRPLFGFCRGADRQDVLVAADMHASAEEETDFEPSMAHRRAREEGEKKREGGGEGKRKNAEKGDGQSTRQNS